MGRRIDKVSISAGNRFSPPLPPPPPLSRRWDRCGVSASLPSFFCHVIFRSGYLSTAFGILLQLARVVLAD
jgi:hypothetical protein